MNKTTKYNHILVLEAPDYKSTVSLRATTYSIGRHSTNSIVIPYESVSRTHATLLGKISQDTNDYYFCIIDGNLDGKRSSNGVFVNGKRCFSKKLENNDVINFGTEVTAQYFQIENQILDEADTTPNIDNQTYQLTKIAHLPRDPQETLVISQRELEQFNVTDLCRMASFPELSPNPIFEINLHGEITYQNPASVFQFENLHHHHLQHPILEDLIPTCQQQQLFVREVNIGQKVFEQYVHYLSESEVIRSYIFDITERKRSEEMLQYQAYHDLLTSLPNRSLFNEQLSLALANANRNQNLLAVMFIDIDRFKTINDSLGHAIGDQLIKAFAQRIKSCLRSGDVVARWGGDEFTVLLPQVSDINKIAKIGQRILDSLKQPFTLEQHRLYVKASVGIAVHPQDGDNGDTLLKNADAALYRAKEEGRNNYQFYVSTMTSEASISLQVENSLYQALERNEFSLYYQPQVNLKTGKIEGVEALIRWEHPELGIVSPGKFIPLAEETGLIIPIGEWVLKTACAQNKAWQQAGLPHLRIGVNLSPRQFQQADLVDTIDQVLAETGLQAKYLELEITESSIMQNIDFACQSLQQLQAMGVQISMDDFGTGYSSLSYLKKFPFHSLKIDQSFVRELNNDPKDVAIIAAVIALGNCLDLRVIAEGVETREQLKLLRGLNCQEMQGYLFSKPLAETAFTQLLHKHFRNTQQKPCPNNRLLDTKLRTES